MVSGLRVANGEVPITRPLYSPGVSLEPSTETLTSPVVTLPVAPETESQPSP